MTSEERIAELERQLEVVRRERDDYRDMLKGIATNINKMLKPVGNYKEAKGDG